MTYEITIQADGNQEDIIDHLRKLSKKLKSKEIKKSLTFKTPTENGEIETQIDVHSLFLKQ